MAGIYIHVPFCKQACSYCDFHFITRQELREQFVRRLHEQIRWFGGTAYAEDPVETIYIGGGTPSLLTAGEIERILQSLEQNFQLKTEEVTMEMNPDDVSPEYLKDLRSAGISRASMGIQTLHAGRLKQMNRAHDHREAEQALDYLKAADFRTFTVDLIYGNPGQSPEDLEKDVQRLLAADPPHISAYSLTIEPRTRLGKLVELGRVQPADEDQVALHFDLLSDLLSSHGLYRYEISNYSKPGHEACHNRSYWHHKNYLGMGPSAHSFWWNEQGARRWLNVRSVQEYLALPFDEQYRDEETLSPLTLAEERLMLGLRTHQGVAYEELHQRYDYRLNESQNEWVMRKAGEGYLESATGRLTFTDKGMKLADYLTVELLRRQ